MSYDSEIDPSLPRDQRKELSAVARRLARERPVPKAAFHGKLRRTIQRAFRSSR